MIIYWLLWIVYGIFGAILVWSNFFVMIHMTTKHWFSKGIRYVLGANSGDPIIAGLAYYGINYFLAWTNINIWLRWYIAATISIILWLFMIIHRVSITKVAADIHISLSYAYSFVKWLLVNASNPLLWIARIAVASYFVIQHPNNPTPFIRFVGWAFMTILMADICKSYYADKITQYINPHKLQLIQRIIGIIIIIIGLVVRQKTTKCSKDIDACISKAQSQVESLLNK